MMKTLSLLATFLLISTISISQSVNDAHPEHTEKTSFRPNAGQWEGDFSHLVYLNQYEAYITNQGLIIGMSPAAELNAHHEAFHDNVAPEDAPDIPVFSYSMVYGGVNLEAETENLNPSDMYRNYFLGPQSQWASEVHDAKSVLKSNVYDGINIHYKIDEDSNLEYDYIIAPGADPSLVSWSYIGVDPIIKESKIHISTPYGLVEETIPEAYQIINGTKIIIDVRFVAEEGNFSFEVGEYDANYELIIDPVIVASTLTGTVGTSNYGHGATYDEQGNVFSFGRSFGSGVPTGAGVIQPDFGGGGTDVVLNKFNPTGTDQIYATYLGGSGEDLPHSAITNLAGDCFVFGSTGSTNYPVIPGAIQTENGGDIDIFISRVSPDGTELIASTYLGGSAVDGRNLLAFGYDSFRGELSLDQEGNVYVASATGSDDFPSTSGAYKTDISGESDGVVAKLSPSLSSAFWITLMGGTEGDMVYGVRVKDNGQVVFAGSTEGSSLTSTTGAYQEAGLGTGINGFAGILNSSGNALLNCTYASTTQEDQAFFLDLDNDENVWIYGRTAGPDEWPISDGVFTTDTKQLFITQFNSELSDIVVSTMVGPETTGGWGSPNPVAFLVDRCDRVYISCYGAPADLPLTDDALFETGGFYLAAFEESLTLLSFGTYYTEGHVDGGTSRFDKKGVVYQGVCSGGGFNTNPDAYATDQTAGWDVGVFKIDFELSGVNAAFSAPSELDGCAPHTIDFANYSVGDTFQWDFGDGSPQSDEFEPSHVYEEPGVYTVTMIASDLLSCNLADTVSLTIDIFSPTDFEPSFDTQIDCETGVVTMINTTGGETFLDFTWVINGDELYTSYNATHEFADLNADNTVGLLAIDEGCDIDVLVTQDITALSDVSAQIGNAATTNCGLDIELENTSTNGVSYLWDFGDANGTSTEMNPSYTYADYGSYTISLTAINSATCNIEDVTTIDINFVEPPQLTQSLNLTQIGTCSELTITGELSNMDNISELTWYVAGEEVGTGADFETQVESQGTYEVVVDIVPSGCPNIFSLSESVELVAELPLDLGPNRDICYYDDGVEIGNLTDVGDAQYLWSPGNQTTPTIMANEPGVYSVLVVVETCSDSRSIEIRQGVRYEEDFELEICEETNNLLEVPVGYKEFLWDNGRTDNKIYVNTAGEYEFEFIDLGGCEQSGTVVVTSKLPDTEMYIPNAFTPNGDGINDIFKPSVSDLDEYNLKIFNRWGLELFDTSDPDAGWNGSSNGGDYFVPPGTYVYLIKYSGVCNKDVIEETGFVTVLR